LIFLSIRFLVLDIFLLLVDIKVFVKFFTFLLFRRILILAIRSILWIIRIYSFLRSLINQKWWLLITTIVYWRILVSFKWFIWNDLALFRHSSIWGTLHAKAFFTALSFNQLLLSLFSRFKLQLLLIFTPMVSNFDLGIGLDFQLSSFEIGKHSFHFVIPNYLRVLTKHNVPFQILLYFLCSIISLFLLDTRHKPLESKRLPQFLYFSCLAISEFYLYFKPFSKCFHSKPVLDFDSCFHLFHG